MKCLIGVDGSAASTMAVRLAGSLLSGRRDKVVLYNAEPPVDLFFDSGTHAEALAKHQAAHRDELFKQATELLPAELATAVETVVDNRAPAEGMLATAIEQDVNCIAVGAHNASRLERLFLGSVSRRLVYAARLPVLVARETAAAASTDRPLRVLFGFDNSLSSRNAGLFLNNLNWPENSTGLVASIVDGPVSDHGTNYLDRVLKKSADSEIAKAFQAQAKADFQQLSAAAVEFQQELPAPFRKSQPIVRAGRASQDLIDIIAAEHIDLVVVGSVGQNFLQKLLIGSTTDRLLHNAPCSLLVVPTLDESS